jgi:phasin family protein
MADNEDTKGKPAPELAIKPTPPVAEPKPAVAEAKPESKPVESKPVEAKLAPVAEAAKPVAAPPVKAPALAKASAPAKPVAKVPEVAKPAVNAKPAVKAKPSPKAQIKTPIKTAPLAKAKPKPVAPVVPAKVLPTKPVIKVAKDVKAPLAAVPVPKAATPKAAPKTAPKTKPVFAGLFTNFMLEEKTMDMSTNFAGLQDAMTEAQAKAKAAFEKSSTVLGEVSEFTKGNVEAVVASGKILAEGVQGIGSELVAEGRTAFETMTGDIKELAAAKSPTDFFKLQGDLVRKNFDSAVAYSSKNSEAMLKLFSDSFAPISGRMSIAMDKARSVSL